MPRQNTAFIAFNRGLVSRYGLARQDIKRIALGAETMENWVARALGPMSIRPGPGYLGSTADDLPARYIGFVYATDDTALLEFTDGLMRVWVNDALVTRVPVTTAVVNGSFDSNLTSWVDNDEAGGTSVWVAGGYMGLTGNGTAAARRRQQVTVPAADLNKEHALHIVIERGPVTLKVGSTSGGDEYINETKLMTGVHSLAFTPTGDFHIDFSSALKRQGLVDSCNVEAAGVMGVETLWPEAVLGKIRGHWEISQSGDVMFLACAGYQQQRVERRATRSWSVVDYQPEDGPFRLTNTGPITITPSALSGNITLAASKPLWRAGHVGALWRITSSGQRVTASITAQNQFTNAILVTGVHAQRIFTIVVTALSGTGTTVRVQRSLTSDAGPWEDVLSYLADTTATHDDSLDNQDAWYRIGVKTGEYVAGTIAVELNYAVGSVDGVVRITSFTDSQNVAAEVMVDLGGTAATDDWAEGQWSDYRGWPTSGAFYEGRLDWSGKNGFDASISDAFDSFDDATEGDSGPISRTIGSGPVDTVNWMLPLQRLVLGAQGGEFSIRASSLDEILTPTNFNLKPATSQGSADVQAQKIDSRGAFVQRGGTRVFELDLEGNAIDYTATDLTLLCPEVGKPRIVRSAVQRQPDTRLHFVRSDGAVAIMIYDKAEQLVCWQTFTTDGTVEDVATLPGVAGDDEDQVYYVVKRTINGATKRYLEKWAKESECIGGTVTKLADCHVVYQGAAVTNIPAGTASHLRGKQVVVWADGADVGSVDGSDGSVTLTHTIDANGQLSPALSAAAANIVVGLPYTAPWKSGKLLQLVAQLGTTLTQMKNIQGLGLIMANVHRRGLQFGRDFTTLRDLPSIEAGASVADSAVRTDYDTPPIPFPGTWSTDERLCLQARAPRPATVLAAVCDVDARG